MKNTIIKSFSLVALLAMVWLSPQVLLAAKNGETVDYKAGGKTYEGYYIASKKNLPLVILIHDWDGLTDYEVRRSKMLADLGYSVFAVDLFGKGVRPTENKDKRQHTGELYADREKMRNIMKASLAQAKKLGADTGNGVAMGYCFGGAAVLELARSGAKLKGFATFHGGLSTPKGQGYQNTRGEILVMHGTADSAISMTDFANLGQELEKNKISHELISYGGAPHGFTVFGGRNYREDADKKSWNSFLKFASRLTGNIN